MDEGMVFFVERRELFELKDEVATNADFFLDEALFEGVDVLDGDGGGASKEVFKDELVSVKGFAIVVKPRLPQFSFVCQLDCQ